MKVFPIKLINNIDSILLGEVSYFIMLTLLAMLVSFGVFANSYTLLNLNNNKTLLPIDIIKLNKLADLIEPVTDNKLLDMWQTQYSCYINKTCQYSSLNAKSFNDALWMKRKGYLSKSIMDLLTQVSIKELSTLASNGNLNALKLMALHSLKQGDIKFAKGYALAAQAKENVNASYSLRLLARVYLADKQPILAAIELRMASLLGDSDATKDYEDLIVANSPPFHNYVNKLAFLFLSQQLVKPIKLWDQDSRPN